MYKEWQEILKKYCTNQELATVMPLENHRLYL